MEWIMLAQTADPISGGAGWVGAGLLGLVLAWLLLKHLPDKDRQLNSLVERHLAIEEKQRHEHGEWLVRQRDDFRTMLGEMLAHSKMQIEGVTKAISVDLQTLRQAVDALRELIEAQNGGSHG